MHEHQKKTGPERDDVYLEWLRHRKCAFCGRQGPSQVSHHGVNGHGVGLKASDTCAVPACWRCHARWHAQGSPIDIWDALDKYEKRDRFAALAAKYCRLYAQERAGLT